MPYRDAMVSSRGVWRNNWNIIEIARYPPRAGQDGLGRSSGAVPLPQRSRECNGLIGMQQTGRPRTERPARRPAVRRRNPARAFAAAAVIWLALPLGGCFSETYQKGYIVPEGALEQIPIGASQDQVLILLGTPSTVATVSGEAFYYISQRAERRVAFMRQESVDQRVIAVYFDRNRRVERIANYGIKDGKIFDFVSRTTPTSGREVNYISGFFNLFSFKP